MKAEALLAQWNEQYERKLESERKKDELERKKIEKEAKIRIYEEAVKYAAEQTREAEEKQRQIDNLLIDTISIEHLNFEILKDNTQLTITPVAPVMEMSREDKRFIEAYAVADEISEECNIAAMDWQDFENLIRELFEKEFSAEGSEVKITQTSHDGGIDAVVFDPNPIRGGKIVIQAKRYTNVVGVSAVRDLYGTVVNEGAMKGILVTTSSYGNDAYNFANGKPITLLNGANLLFLMEKHGYKAKIDIKEAKKVLKDVNK